MPIKAMNDALGAKSKEFGQSDSPCFDACFAVNDCPLT